MQEICWPGVLLLVVFCLEFHQVSLLQCAGDKRSCIRSATCRQSLECKIRKYRDADCLPDNANTDSYRMCDNGRNCYLDIDSCDGVLDCVDGADEDESKCCSEGYYRCDFMLRQVCYSQDEICDGKTKCWDDSDELNCTRCSNSKKTCDHGKRCYSWLETCDGVKHCLDNQDEQNCPIKTEETNNDEGFRWKLEPFVALPIAVVLTLVIVISCCRYMRKQAERGAQSVVRQNEEGPAQACQFQSAHSYVAPGRSAQDRNTLLGIRDQSQHSGADSPVRPCRTTVPTGHLLRPRRHQDRHRSDQDRHRSASRENLQSSAPLLPPNGSSVPGDVTYPSNSPLFSPQSAFVPSAPTPPTAGYVQAPYLNPPGSWQGPSAPPPMGPSGISTAPPPSYESLFPQK